MQLPKSIQIGTIDYCNRACPWCPESYLEKTPDRLMPMHIFNKILNDLQWECYEGNLHLYLMGEPLCDPRIHALIRQARGVFPDNTIFISTNGDGLTSKEDVKALLDAGLTWMAISDYDKQARFAEYTAIFPNVVVSTLDQLQTTFYNRGGHVDVPCAAPYQVCSWVMDKGYINYKGEVILCCSDYRYQVVFGNIMDTPFGEIYNSPEYRHYKKMHMQGRGKELPLCKECNRI